MGVVLLDRLLHCDGICIVLGSLSLLGLITGSHVVIMHLVRTIVLKVWPICSWGLLTRPRDSFDGHNVGLLLASKKRMPTGHRPAQ